jgi:hypothetical protein
VPPPRDEVSLGLQLAVGPGNGVGGQRQIGREAAHRGQLRARREIAIHDLLDQLPTQLIEGRMRILRIDPHLDVHCRSLMPMRTTY